MSGIVDLGKVGQGNVSGDFSSDTDADLQRNNNDASRGVSGATADSPMEHERSTDQQQSTTMNNEISESEDSPLRPSAVVDESECMAKESKWWKTQLDRLEKFKIFLKFCA